MNIQIKEKITAISNYKIIDLIHEESDFNFVEAKNLIENLINKIASTLQYPEFFETILNEQQIINPLHQLEQTLQRIKEFDATKISNPTTEKQNLINSVKTLNNDLDNTFLQRYLVFFIRKQSEKGANKKLEKELQEIIKKINLKDQEAEKILLNLRKTSGQTGISQYEKVFEQEAKSNKKSARIWLIAFVISGLAIISGLAFLFLNIPTSEIENYIWYISINRIVLVSIAGYLLYQLVKNYNANMHLYTKNTHRKNCLRVFEKIRDSANDENTKDEILKQAARTIFESGETGYIATREDGKDIGAINIIERLGNGIKGK